MAMAVVKFQCHLSCFSSGRQQLRKATDKQLNKQSIWSQSFFNYLQINWYIMLDIYNVLCIVSILKKNFHYKDALNCHIVSFMFLRLLITVFSNSVLWCQNNWLILKNKKKDFQSLWACTINECGTIIPLWPPYVGIIGSPIIM